MRPLIALVLALILIPSVFAIGATPAQITKIVGKDDLNFEIEPFSTNDALIEVYVVGPLADKIKLNKKDYLPNETIKGTVLSTSDVRPGKHTNQVIVREVPGVTKGVSATSEVAVLFVVQVPTPDVLLFADWGMALDDAKKDLSVTVTVENVGDSAVEVRDMMLVVLEQDVQKGVVFFEDAWVEPSSFKQFRAKYDGLSSGIITPGVYTTALTAQYGNKLLEVEKPFTFGTPILNISFLAYFPEQGDIHPIDVEATSVWNKEVPLTVALYKDSDKAPFSEESVESGVMKRFYLDVEEYGFPENNITAVVSYGPSIAYKIIHLQEYVPPPERRSLMPYALLLAVVALIALGFLAYRIKKEDG